jgi:hypothetical protein
MVAELLPELLELLFVELAPEVEPESNGVSAFPAVIA